MPTTANRIGNTTVSGNGGARIVTAGDTANKVGNTTVSGGGTVRAKSGGNAAMPNSTLSRAKSSNNGAANFSPTGSNPMTQNNDQTASAPQTAAANASVPGGYNPIRQTLNSRGISNDRIGWNNGYVTIDGQNAYQPQYNDNGTTYAGDYAMNDITRQAYSQAGDPLVAVRDYATTSGGYGGAVDWDGSNATVGGIPVDTIYVQDGNAYAPRSAVDAAIAQMEQNNGLIGNDGVTQAYEDRYGGVVDDALDTLLNRRQWDYDPNEDLAWQVYRNQYTQLGDDAFRRALNANNSSVYGASGAALSEALAARNNYMQQLSYQLPELMRDSYNRYTGETARLRDNLADSRDVGNDYYARMYQQNRDTYNDVRNSWLDERDQERWETEDMRNAAMAAAELAAQQRQNTLLDQQIQQGDTYNNYYDQLVAQQLRGDTLNNDLLDQNIINAAIENNAQRSSIRGAFTPEEAEFYGLRYDPTTGKAYNAIGQEVTPYSGAYEYEVLMGLAPADSNRRAVANGWLIQ